MRTNLLEDGANLEVAGVGDMGIIVKGSLLGLGRKRRRGRLWSENFFRVWGVRDLRDCGLGWVGIFH